MTNQGIFRGCQLIVVRTPSTMTAVNINSATSPLPRMRNQIHSGVEAAAITPDSSGHTPIVLTAPSNPTRRASRLSSSNHSGALWPLIMDVVDAMFASTQVSAQTEAVRHTISAGSARRTSMM